MKKKRQKLNHSILQRITLLRLNGASPATIAKEVNLSLSSAARYCSIVDVVNGKEATIVTKVKSKAKPKTKPKAKAKGKPKSKGMMPHTQKLYAAIVKASKDIFANEKYDAVLNDEQLAEQIRARGILCTDATLSGVRRHYDVPCSAKRKIDLFRKQHQEKQK